MTQPPQAIPPQQFFMGVLDLAIVFAVETMTEHKKPLLWVWFETRDIFRRRLLAEADSLTDLL